MLKYCTFVYVFLDEDLVGPSLLVHTSVPYSIQHVEADKEAMKPILMEFLNDLLPNLPQPDFIKSHKWRYSQVSGRWVSCSPSTNPSTRMHIHTHTKII